VILVPTVYVALLPEDACARSQPPSNGDGVYDEVTDAFREAPAHTKRIDLTQHPTPNGDKPGTDPLSGNAPGGGPGAGAAVELASAIIARVIREPAVVLIPTTEANAALAREVGRRLVAGYHSVVLAGPGVADCSTREATSALDHLPTTAEAAAMINRRPAAPWLAN
jgi:hypothetical protein